MKTEKRRLQIIYALCFVIILIIEVLIALFVRDSFIRPYGGDILVTILICCFVRTFVPENIKLLPIFVFFFSVTIEIGQYFNFVALLGLGDIKFFRILLGTSFSVIDLLCYGVGCVLFFIGEKIVYHFLNKQE